MKLVDPTDPFMVNLNGKTIDASQSGLVNPQNQPIKSGKGDRLTANQKKKEHDIRIKKNHTMNLWFQENIEKILPKQASKVKTSEDVEKLMKKHGIQTIQELGINSDYTGIIQGNFIGKPNILASKLWQWKK